MDFASLKTKMTPFLNTAKEYGEKALDFTQRQAQGTPVFLKTEEAYNIHISSKRAIIVGYDEKDPLSQEVILRSPLWAAKAWTDAAEIRYISLTQTPELGQAIKMVGPIEMRVFFGGEETLHTNDLSEMKNWWDNRVYKKEDSVAPGEPGTTDPLESK